MLGGKAENQNKRSWVCISHETDLSTINIVCTYVYVHVYADGTTKQ